MNLNRPPQANRDAAMTARTSLGQLGQGEVAAVMVITQERDGPVVSQLRPTQRALPALTDVVRTAAGEFANCEVIDYAPATSIVEGQIMWASASSVPLLQTIVQDSQDLAGMPVFDPATSKLSAIKLAAMRVEVGDTAALFVQNLRGDQIVAQSRRYGVIVRRGVIDLPPRGQMLLFTRDVAAIVVGDIALFKDRPAFERLFGYLAQLQQRATATLQTVTANLRITGFDKLAVAVTTSPAMLGKMASIQRKLDQFPQYREALTMPRLLDFVRDHPECGVETQGQGNTAELVYRNDPQHRFKILKLLDDDYLRSELTRLEYETNSKSPPIGT